MSTVNLNLKKACCRQGTSMTGAISPFNRVLALEQGGQLDPHPLAAMAQCQQCSDCWSCTLCGLQGELKCYRLARLPAQALQQLADAYSQLRKPKWPLWIPPGWDQMRLEDARRLQDLEQGLWQRAQTPSLVIATRALINGRISAVFPYDDQIRDWTTKLGA